MATASVLNRTQEEPTNCVDEEERRCLHCQSPSLHVDWSAGDRVCTNCGVVNEQHIRDDRPEWREFHESDDLAKGLPSLARCGMVPVDESRYLGGLQPTTLSKRTFGSGVGGVKGTTSRRRLLSTNRRIDLMMVRNHAKALNEAKVSRQVRRRKQDPYTDSELTTDCTVEDEDSVRPEHDQLLIQEEEDAQRACAALNAEKWSLERAILLHGSDDEQSNVMSSSSHGPQQDREAEREDLLKRLDGSLRRASADLYRAYIMLREAARKLQLPDRVNHEATNMLCRYAARRNGFFVKGVSSRVSTKKGDGTDTEKKKKSAEEKETLERLREFNKLKQMASLESALLYLTARNLGWARSVPEVCSSFHLNIMQSVHPNARTAVDAEVVIRPKHCFRAVNEIKATFPDYVRSTAPLKNAITPGVSDLNSTERFVEHATRKLGLPPVALVSINMLVVRCQKEQAEMGKGSGVKLSTMCASITYFVCMAGATMQKLAKQAQSKKVCVPSTPLIHANKRKITDSPEADTPRKMVKLEGDKAIGICVPTLMQDSCSNGKASIQPFARDPTSESMATVDDQKVSSTVAAGSSSSPDAKSKPHGELFDVFSHAPVDEDPTANLDYEMRRIWDTWAEQMPWYRNVGRVEQSCGVSRKDITDYYKKRIYPRRQVLLSVLKDSTLPGRAEDTEAYESIRDTPLASVLLSNITAAAPLMSSKGKD